MNPLFKGISVRISLSSSNRVRLHIRIQRLPHNRHTLTQTLRIKGPGADLRAECLHVALECCRSRARLRVHAAKHGRVVEHVEQSAIGADKERTSKECGDRKLLQHLDKGREEVDRI